MEAIQNSKGDYIPVTRDGFGLAMLQGGAITYRSEFEAICHSRLYLSGYIGGAIESELEDILI